MGSHPETIVASHGAVATDDRRCSKIGVDVPRGGGHVGDATVAAALCPGLLVQHQVALVEEPASGGIGVDQWKVSGFDMGVLHLCSLLRFCKFTPLVFFTLFDFPVYQLKLFLYSSFIW
ncbi:unnamed protein product [Citrullus colocynthis]|uniref:Uncharacterized protein n=1 Tax=Citrullus colocynthis TaxID=252529 RepID=A0ABP0YJF9_9ROSI